MRTLYNNPTPECFQGCHIYFIMKMICFICSLLILLLIVVIEKAVAGNLVVVSLIQEISCIDILRRVSLISMQDFDLI